MSSTEESAAISKQVSMEDTDDEDNQKVAAAKEVGKYVLIIM